MKRQKGIEGLRDIIAGNGNREKIAARMKRTTRTIERWALGVTNPSPAESEKLRRIINGMQQANNR